MKKIRTKFILIFVAVVLLPLFPIIWLVNGLVQQSYRIGVNPRVEAALEKGVDYSRELYRIRKIHLLETLSKTVKPELFREILTGAPGASEKLALLQDTGEWQFLSLRVYDAQGKLLGDISKKGIAPTVLNGGHFAQAGESPEGRIIITNREKNRFIAIEKRVAADREGYVVLIAALPEEFIRQTDQSLEVYQLYRSLSLSPISIPGSFLFAFVVITLLILIVMIGVAVWLSRRLTNPIGELVEGTREVGRGNLDYRVKQRSNDEIGILVQHFNRMAEELKISQEKTIYLEKMAAWQEIARRLAHEIKNPLTPIQLTVQEMVDQYPGENREYHQLLKECHGIIDEEIENLRRLVREFSDFGRLPEPRFAEGDIHVLIKDIQRLYPHREFQLDLAEGLPPLQMDEDRIRRVLINLIENAAQADPEKHPITIQTRWAVDHVEVSVTDRGSGIPPEMQKKIFEPYFSTQKSGIGLGLAITRKMVEEHGGEIWVESNAGIGSSFTFTLPVKNAAMA
jgi:nitrogen fixation/metabolism regulation signal transduction histidine kinase